MQVLGLNLRDLPQEYIGWTVAQLTGRTVILHYDGISLSLK